MDLKVGGVYRMTARNFFVGAYTGRSQRFGDHVLPEFIGIREKFGYRYLTSEAGWNVGEQIGTIPPHAKLEEDDKTLYRSLAQFARKDVP